MGKAVIKMLLQKTFVILAFNEQYVIKLISAIRLVPFPVTSTYSSSLSPSSVPVIGEHVGRVVQAALLQQKASLHRNASDEKVSCWLIHLFYSSKTGMISYVSLQTSSDYLMMTII